MGLQMVIQNGYESKWGSEKAKGQTETEPYHLIATTIETEIKRLNDDNSADGRAYATIIPMRIMCECMWIC